MKKYIVGIILSALMALFAPAVLAVPYVIGNITISGGATYDSILGTATTVTAFNNPIVQSVDGDLATTVSTGNAVAFTTPFVFGVSTPYATLYSVGGWNFELISSQIDFQNQNFLAISGTGEITGNGYSPTPAIFLFSTQNIQAGGTYSFSASNGALPVNDHLGGLMTAAVGILILTFKRFA